MGNIGHLAGTIHHDKDVGLAAHKHQVVHDAAGFVEQQAVALLAYGQIHHVHRHQAFKGRSGIGSDQAQLAHMRDIKQSGGRARVVVFGHQAGRVLHRHGVTGKRHHARTEFNVQGVQGRGLQGS